MGSKKCKFFFRNDDVRNHLDDSLVKVTDLFIKHNIPISHAVEPANVSTEVVNWLLKLKEKYPQLIEIIQHGYDHKIKNLKSRGEFGGDRNYEEQYKEIKKGKELMCEYFDNLWFEAFTVPYGVFNNATFQALNNAEFKVVNTLYKNKFKNKLLYTAGHILNKGLIRGHRISWHLRNYPRSNLFVIDMNINFIKKYIDDKENAEMKSLEEMISSSKSLLDNDTVGVLLHHRYHHNKDKLDLVDNFLSWVKKNGFPVTNQENIFYEYKKMIK